MYNVPGDVPGDVPDSVCQKNVNLVLAVFVEATLCLCNFLSY